jgi:hypothetical protein
VELIDLVVKLIDSIAKLIDLVVKLIDSIAKLIDFFMDDVSCIPFSTKRVPNVAIFAVDILFLRRIHHLDAHESQKRRGNGIKAPKTEPFK